MAQVEKRLENLLQYGTWTATATTTIGVLFNSMTTINCGIGLFILIPVGRVLGLLLSFIKEKDLKMASAGFIVMSIIVLSFLMGVTH
ncbi:DUF1634 domain-containing protein [Peredibacter starrii]|uniref:DUF1634 domain-containing protein n=1 Tax=Peredibacter starrii TaxID=28202 RepID=A0AAX4HU42_9BACT|nr:DUF1634 domain-containing protein [Peredibacter starrii]WPU66603.1 DUF1634 domain-containing protein [Peredibacter starrii]